MIKLSASVSKKVPLQDIEYSSRSCSAGAEVEMPGDASPEELKEKLRTLYRTLEEAVDEQLQGSAQPAHQKELPEETRRALSKRTGGNGNGRKATEAQVGAILAIAAEHGLSEQRLRDMLQEKYGTDAPENLSLKDASALIGLLKNGKEGLQ
jgi:hypothetical protein